MSTKRKPQKPQELEKARTEAAIVFALQKGRLRWKDLKKELEKQETAKSPRTLSDRLRELMKKGIVRRITDDSVYPPAVSYELTSNAVLLTGRENAVVHILNMMKEEIRGYRRIMQVLSDKDSSAEEFLEFNFGDFFTDFLVTLKFSFEHPEMTPYLVFSSKEFYAVRLERLIEAGRESAELSKVVLETLQEIRDKSKQDRNRFLEKATACFNDKPLAKAIVEFYALNVTFEHEKDNAYEFLKRIIDNKEIRNELEKQFGGPIDDQRLKKILEEPAWKTLTVESKF